MRRTLDRIVRGLGAALACSTFLCASAAAQDEPERDGKWLYQYHCAGCHNDNGDGKGPTITALGLAARDFKQGGFAFGDSREQIFKTIASGIPGRSPMPSFAEVASEEERWKIVDYVRTLMPPRKDEAPKRTEMIVADRALIARGKLPPIGEGAKETTRGLLIGTPQGMTFEYDLANVRLLGVRLGRFADREDWGDRGGGYLKPLGQLVWKPEDIEQLEFELGASSTSPKRVERELKSTWMRDGKAGLLYVVRRGDDSRELLATVTEIASTRVLPLGPCFVRTRNVRFADSSVELSVLLGGAPGTLIEEHGLITQARGENGVDVTILDGSGLEALRGRTTFTEFGLARNSSDDVTFTMATIRTNQLTPELAAQLRKEFRR